MRQTSFELFRILAICGVVWYHTGAYGGEIAYSGLNFFLLVSIYFFVQNIKKWRFHDHFLRVLLPWFAWYPFYGVLNFIRGDLEFFFTPPYLSIPLVGPSVHLWFLPFIYMAHIAVLWFVNTKTNLWKVPSLYVMLILWVIGVSYWKKSGINLGIPLSQWIQASGAVLAGVIFAITPRKSLLRYMLIVVLFSAWLIDSINIYLQLIVAAACFVLCETVTVQTKKESWINQIAAHSFGVYLVHIAVLIVLRKMLETRMELIAALAILLSFCVVGLLKRLLSRKIRRVLLAG